MIAATVKDMMMTMIAAISIGVLDYIFQWSDELFDSSCIKLRMNAWYARLENSLEVD
jgi:hypothetical protein